MVPRSYPSNDQTVSEAKYFEIISQFMLTTQMWIAILKKTHILNSISFLRSKGFAKQPFGFLFFFVCVM